MTPLINERVEQSVNSRHSFLMMKCNPQKLHLCQIFNVLWQSFDFILSGVYTMEFVKRVLVFVNSNAIDLRQSAPPH